MSAWTPSEVVQNADDLVRLQRTAYAAEAQLIADHRIPQLRETATELVAQGLAWFVASDAWVLVGAIAVSVESNTVDIERLAIDPDHARRGIGRQLVTCAFALGPRAVVSTARGNYPARSLYEELGFVATGDHEVLPGLWTTHYAKDV